MSNEIPENEISGRILDSAFEVHRTLGGPGLLESVYEEALTWELERMGVNVRRRVSVPVEYKGAILTTPMKIDPMVEDKVIVECKAVETYNPVFEAQALTHLKPTGLRLGLVIDFGERLIRQGFHRVVNRL